MEQKYLIIYFRGKPIVVRPLTSLDGQAFIEIKKEADKNLTTLFEEYDAKQTELLNKIQILEKEIKLLKGEE